MNIQSSFYRSVNGIERAPCSNLARLPAISSFWTLFVGIYATKRKSCTGVSTSFFPCILQLFNQFAINSVFPKASTMNLLMHTKQLTIELLTSVVYETESSRE